MNDTRIIWVVIALAVIAAIVVASVMRVRQTRERTRLLRERFGPEYDRAVRQFGRRGEAVLGSRLERVEKAQLRELGEADRSRFSRQWTEIQAQFVDNPSAAVGRANDLIKEVMRARGYSADEGFEQRAADLSVDHPEVVEHYRAARSLSQKRPEEGRNTEQLRQAVVHYRALFADLLQPDRVEAPGMLTPQPV